MDVHQATISVAVMDSAGKLILESILVWRMHSFCDDRQFTGIETYGQIALRIPLLWPIVPFL
jgi:hypothetical protein